MISLKKLADVKPELRQLEWQNLEFYGFIHFGINTFFNREWGNGLEHPEEFKPEDLDCEQWVATLKASGMKGVILTCKHHDGFCLWPSKYSKHTVAYSPWKQGQGDVVRELSEVCRKENFKLGIYLSPWDRADHRYGTGEEYDDYFVHQLEELLTNYGEIFEVWFDGANGEKEGKHQQYNWNRYYDVIRRCQPNAVIAVCGPDVRWIGNEAGQARKNEWSVVPESLRDCEKIAENSQKIDDGSFSTNISSVEQDLGSRAVIEACNQPVVWYPAEVNTSIRPGWFYHLDEDNKVKSSDYLFNLYKRAVGGNSTFLLNVPPTKKGVISPADCQILQELGEKISFLKTGDTSTEATFTYSFKEREDLTLASHRKERIWKPLTVGELPFVEITWTDPQMINIIILKENIKFGQKIEAFQVYLDINGCWTLIGDYGTVGYQRIIDIDSVVASKMLIVFSEYRGEVLVSDIEIINLPQ